MTMARYLWRAVTGWRIRARSLDSMDKKSILGCVTGNQFRELREKIGYTQSILSREMDVTIRTITRWETDDSPIPKMAELALRYLAAEKPKRKKDSNGLQS